MKFYNQKQYKTVLSNGEIHVDIVCSRFSCSLDLPRGVEYSVLNGEHYLNGKRAWFEVMEV